MFYESSNSHQEKGDVDRARVSRGEKNIESPSRDSEPQHIRVIHTGILGEEPRYCRDEPQPTQGGGLRLCAKFTRATIGRRPNQQNRKER